MQCSVLVDMHATISRSLTKPGARKPDKAWRQKTNREVSHMNVGDEAAGGALSAALWARHGLRVVGNSHCSQGCDSQPFRNRAVQGSNDKVILATGTGKGPRSDGMDMVCGKDRNTAFANVTWCTKLNVQQFIRLVHELNVQQFIRFVEVFSCLSCWMRLCAFTIARDVVDLLAFVFCFASHRILDGIQHIVLTCHHMYISCSACVCKRGAASW
jgi:hypothetical protein